MHHDPMSDGMMFQPLPEWILSSLGILFLVFSLFYFWRLARPSMVKNAIGFFDWEGEAGHAICMLAMASSLAFWLVPVPGFIWVWVLGGGTIYYALRAMTWGRRLSFNKQWWDWTHSGMYLGMFTMFYTLPIGATLNMILGGLLTVFWIWFSLLYVRDSYLDFRARKALSFGSDLAHLGMGLAMLAMSLFPGLLMDHQNMPHHHHQMTQVPESAICTTPTTPHVVIADDTTFANVVLAEKGPVVILVFGGCENCATEVPIFERIATSYSSKAKFVRINKDSSESACKALGVDECPHILVMENGSVKARIDSFADEAEMRRFIDNALAMNS